MSTIEEAMNRPHNEALRILRETAEDYRHRASEVIAASAVLVSEIGVDGCPKATQDRAAAWSRVLAEKASKIDASIKVLEAANRDCGRRSE